MKVTNCRDCRSDGVVAEVGLVENMLKKRNWINILLMLVVRQTVMGSRDFAIRPFKKCILANNEIEDLNPAQVTIFDDFCGIFLLLTDTKPKALRSDARIHVKQEETTNFSQNKQSNQMVKSSLQRDNRSFSRLHRLLEYATVSFRAVVYKTPAAIADREKATKNAI